MPGFTLPKNTLPKNSRTARGSKLASLAAAVVSLPLLLTGCTDNTKAADASGGAINVVSSNTDCKVSTASVPSGNLTFSVKNEGTEVTEFYLLAADGLRILGEVENIGPGLSRNLVVTAPAGTYTTACKPGMEGDGIRGALEVTQSGDQPTADADFQHLLDTATAQYASYVKDQGEQLLTGTEQFAAAFAAGNAGEAKRLYAATRQHWERIEPVAESFGDLDPQLDAREADLEPGQEWTGWHRAEKDLFPPAGYTAMTPAERSAIADRMVADTKDLVERTRTLEISADMLGNGAKELLDEVATGKVTGEEEIWSHTDLWDFQANVDGARIAFESLKPALLQKDSALAASLDEKFAALQAELATHAQGADFTSYDKLTPEQVQRLASLVDALGEPLSRLTAAVVL
ncbi:MULTISPECIES: iron uptake system protein EfeO [unclassified Arthrobacter]|uniref:iron uptake system protein EfeO n=1 Tax=unclassified Arthrobacter TaxID=235627 RepID=UPI001F47FAF4|nr:iron uptake system protein EfeO [Arthrobacter sp. FW306-06-A]UKA70154.1 EfeM/EfeO family lipoprotein [Arthrobacter sp. FW306-06-A]